MVPVDFVADAIDHISHEPDLDGKAFHLTDPNPLRAGQILNVFANSAHAPQASMRIDPKMLDVVPPAVRGGLMMLPPVKRITDTVLEDLGIPRDVLVHINYPTKFDCSNTLAALEGTGISVPPLAPTQTSSGTTGSATSTPTCSRTARLAARSAARS